MLLQLLLPMLPAVLRSQLLLRVRPAVPGILLAGLLRGTLLPDLPATLLPVVPRILRRLLLRQLVITRGIGATTATKTAITGGTATTRRPSDFSKMSHESHDSKSPVTVSPRATRVSARWANSQSHKRDVGWLARLASVNESRLVFHRPMSSWTGPVLFLGQFLPLRVLAASPLRVITAVSLSGRYLASSSNSPAGVSQAACGASECGFGRMIARGVGVPVYTDSSEQRDAQQKPVGRTWGACCVSQSMQGCPQGPPRGDMSLVRMCHHRRSGRIVAANRTPSCRRPPCGAHKNAQGREVSLCCCESLGKLGPEAKSAIPALSELLNDTNEDIRKAASKALEKIKREK